MKGLLISIFVILILILLSLFIAFLYRFIYFRFVKKMELPVKTSKYKRKSFFRKIYVDLPYQFWLDRFNAIPCEFKEYGLHLICGEQGSGKTTAVVDLLLNNWCLRYPRLKIYTNMFLKGQDGEITHWKDLLSEKRNNGVYGVVNVIDEISSWFSSLQSKDFPPEMLSEISQQRKQRKVILGTAQVFR